MESCLALCSDVTPGGAQGTTYVVPKIKPESADCKASTLLSPALKIKHVRAKRPATLSFSDNITERLNGPSGGPFYKFFI